MSKFDQQQLLATLPPFDLLSRHTIENLASKMDIAYYREDSVLISPEKKANALRIIIKGGVEETLEGELHNVYSYGDSFGASPLMGNNKVSIYKVSEDLICYELAKKDFLDLLENEEAFKTFYLQNFLERHQHIKAHQAQSELTPFLVAKVHEIFLHKACIVSCDTSIYASLESMKAMDAHVIIVQDNDALGIVTDTDLRDKVLLGGIGVNEAVGSIASYGLISIDNDDFLFNALLLMTQHSIKRLIVTDKGKVTGVLEQLDLLSFFANHSHLIAVQIDKAQNINDLIAPQNDLRSLVVSLHAKGVKTRYISKMVTTLNSKIYKKVFELSVPYALQDKCALFVMGSEGRQEQVLRSDQDNALVIKEGEDVSRFSTLMQDFNDNLSILGFPQCSGNVMVTNKYWCRSVNSYKALIETWVSAMDESSLQSLSIFMDASFVAGEKLFLERIKNYLFEQFEGRSDVLTHVSKAVFLFDTPLSMFSAFTFKKEDEARINIKKGGIFALVHGVRTLALEYGVVVTNTIERIRVLKEKGLFDEAFQNRLIEAYDTLLTLRLKIMLASKNGEVNCSLDPDSLEKIERDLLKDSFKVVNEFKKFLRYHYHLEMVL